MESNSKVWKEMNKDNAAKKCFSVRIGVAHFGTNQKMLLVLMMRMVIGLCES